MARTDEAAVRKIIESDDTIDVTPFIEMANELVTECCADAGYTETRLEMIERLLAAHFYCLRDMRAKSEKAGSVGQSYDTKLDLYFTHTHHGQMALMMDTAGGLLDLQEEAMGERRVVPSGTWLGTPKDEWPTS